VLGVFAPLREALFWEVAVAHKSFGQLCDAVEGYTGNSTAGAALPLVQAGYDRVLLGLDPRGGYAHAWSFLEVLADLAITLSITGTAKGEYDAGNDLTTITATTAIFVPSQIGETITVTDGGGAGVPLSLTVASYTSPTIIVADAGNAFNGKTVSLPHTGIYSLPADFGGMVEAPVYPHDGAAWVEFEEVSPEEIFADWRASNTRGTARKFALAAVAQPAAQTVQYYAIIVSPRPEADRKLRYRYLVDAAAAVDSAAAYPLGWALLGPLYEAAALAEAEIKASGAPGRWEKRFQELMVVAIDRDKAMFGTDGTCQLAEP
jgi:hypothetical protein